MVPASWLGQSLNPQAGKEKGKAFITRAASTKLPVIPFCGSLPLSATGARATFGDARPGGSWGPRPITSTPCALGSFRLVLLRG